MKVRVEWGRSMDITSRRGPKVEVFPGVVGFKWIEFEAEVEGVSFAASGLLALDDPPSRYELDWFRINRAGAGQAVTSSSARTVPIDGIVGMVLYAFGTDHELPEDGVLGAGVEYRDLDYNLELRGRGLDDPEALQFVAATYLRASLSGGAPLETLMFLFDCSKATASRWVAASKDAGLLRVARRTRR
jgi:hypothetical protein